MPACGLHRSRRGAIVGHMAMFEMTSARPNRRYGNTLRRLGLDDETTDFNRLVSAVAERAYL